MTRRPVIVADSAIPFLPERLDSIADASYLPGRDFSPESVRDADAIIVRTRTRCDAALLAGSNVRLVATATIGTDHIDLEWCRQNGITVINAPGCNAPGVAQWVWSSILSLTDCRPATVGIVGVGNVGRIVAEWGRALGYRILLNDPPRRERGDISEIWTPLDRLLKEADAVTIHVPFSTTGNHPTSNLIGESQLALMRRGALLLNAARGGIVDEEALLPLLNSGKIQAVLDTWCNEPDINREVLSATTLATPHIAGYSQEGKECATRMVLEAVCSFFAIENSVCDGLAGLYNLENNQSPAAADILDSYAVFEDAISLYRAPEQFEALRSNYIYRHEPSRR